MGEFFDYGTQEVSSDTDLFDTSRTGMSYYNQFLDDPEYMRSEKNLDGQIIMMSPREYFQECAKIFNSTADKQLQYTQADSSTLKHLQDVILKARSKFPVTFLNYADSTQEGRHRMYTAAMLTSWDTKFPVLVIDWFDKQRHEAEVESKRIRDIEYRIDDAINQTLQYEYSQDDPEALYDELQIQMNHAFGHYYGDPDVEFTLDVDEDQNTYSITKDNVTRDFQATDIKWERKDVSDVDGVTDDESVDDFLAKYL